MVVVDEAKPQRLFWAFGPVIPGSHGDGVEAHPSFVAASAQSVEGHRHG